jgi:hypothetical protein
LLQRRLYQIQRINRKSITLTETSKTTNDRKSYTGAQVLRWVHEEKLTG